MASLKQIEANRLNSHKSTGPRSAEGQAVSRMNALKSGIDAKSQIIRGEKAASLEALIADYYRQHHPTTPEQRMLVDTLIDSEWLLRRFRLCESQLWEQGAQFAMKPDDEIENGQAFRGNSDYFARLQRRIDAAYRNYYTALHELERLQAEAAALPAPEPPLAPQPDPPGPPNQSPTLPIGFVPQLPSENPIEAPPAASAPEPPSPPNPPNPRDAGFTGSRGRL
jgi:hypothetical protein